MIAVVNLTKAFGSLRAVSRVTFSAGRGESIGLVGPSGGGRTTLLRMIATILQPTAGTLEIDGIDAVRRPYEVRARIAYVGGEWLPGHGLRVREHLAFIRAARRVPGNDALHDVFTRAGLSGDASVDRLSAGLRQRLTLAAALQLKPAVLLLDDPFRALDADARAVFREWIQELRDQQTTIVAALNSDAETSALCDRRVRLESGRLVLGTRGDEGLTVTASSGRSVPTCAQP